MSGVSSNKTNAPPAKDLKTNFDQNSFDDDAAQALARQQKYRLRVLQLRAEGSLVRSDQDQPSLKGPKPAWFNETLFKNASSVYERHFMGCNFAHLSGLLLLVRVDSIYRTLCRTGESDSVPKLFKRYYNTVKHIKQWYEGDIFEDGSDAQRSFLIVRGMHNKVASKLNFGDCVLDQPGDENQNIRIASNGCPSNVGRALVDDSEGRNCSIPGPTLHLSQYDIMITQFAFVGFIVTQAKSMGLIEDFSEHDLASMLHFWRVIGHYLGASESYNLCSNDIDDIRGLCEAITDIEYRQSLVKSHLNTPPGIMSVNIVRSIKFIPMLTVYGMLRYLYELLGHPHNEISDRSTCYSNLSYTLIKLVMSRLLAYKPFRSFNNGLTRLSLYSVGHIEEWFSQHLESKYGNDLVG